MAAALGHAVLPGLPLVLVFRLKGWVNVMSCVALGFAVGAVPAGVLTWPMEHPELHTSASVDGVPTPITGVHDIHRMVQRRQAPNLFRLARGSRRIRILGRADMVRHLRKNRRGHRSFTSFLSQAPDLVKSG